MISLLALILLCLPLRANAQTHPITGGGEVSVRHEGDLLTS
jgi:hypothetical protein